MGITFDNLQRALFITPRAAHAAAQRYISDRIVHEIVPTRMGTDRGFAVLLSNRADGSYLGHIGLEA